MERKSQDEQVVEGEVERVTYESADGAFRVLRLHVDGESSLMTVVGSFPRVSPGARVRVRGNLVEDKRHGEQFRAVAVTELSPSTLTGIERYLGSGMIKGIGETYAKRIVATFGMETLRVLDEEPGRLLDVPGLGGKRASSIASAWGEQRGIRDMMVFLQAHGASPALATRIWKRYGSKAVALVSEDPYRLSLDVWGVGFKTADRMAASLGVAADSPTRLQSGLLQCLRDAGDSGHIYVPLDSLVERAAELLGFGPQQEPARTQLGAALSTLAANGHVVAESDGETSAASLIFSKPMYEAELRIADGVADLVATGAVPLRGAQAAIAEFEMERNTALSSEQRQAVEQAAVSRLLVVTGGPGVGKTTVVRAIIAVFVGQQIEVRLAAPTGRAAKRMSEATGRDAGTLHRLLEFDPKTASFRRDAGNPIDAGVLIVDEASMIDVPMADALIAALGKSRLILVGDVDQLPSVGPGAVLRDLLASRAVPSVRLTQIFRQAQSSLIVVNAHRINHGEPPMLPPRGDPADTGADFFVIERNDPEAAKDTIVELVTTRIPRRFGLDPIADIQVLAPMHKGAAGSIALNDALQNALNPRTEAVTKGRRSFRMGDKVMQLKNDYDRNVWNGDVGVIVRIDWDEEAVVVGFDRKPSSAAGDAPAYEREVAYDSSMLDELTLAYACSVHKAQGSEYPAVVIPFLTSHFVMLTRNLLYTAITRGKRLVVLVADPRAVSLALAADRNDQRKTQLASRIARLLA